MFYKMTDVLLTGFINMIRPIYSLCNKMNFGLMALKKWIIGKLNTCKLILHHFEVQSLYYKGFFEKSFRDCLKSMTYASILKKKQLGVPSV